MTEENEDHQSHNCPFCESEETCTHKYAVYDATWDCIEEGHLIDIKGVEAILSQYFINHIKKHRENTEQIDQYDEFFQELWHEVIDSNDNNEFLDKIDFNLPNYSRFIFEMLSSIEELSDGGLEAGPGQSNVLYEFFSDDSRKMNEQLLQKVIHYLN